MTEPHAKTGTTYEKLMRAIVLTMTTYGGVSGFERVKRAIISLLNKSDAVGMANRDLGGEELEYLGGLVLRYLNWDPNDAVSFSLDMSSAFSIPGIECFDVHSFLRIHSEDMFFQAMASGARSGDSDGLDEMWMAIVIRYRYCTGCGGYGGLPVSALVEFRDAVRHTSGRLESGDVLVNRAVEALAILDYARIT